MVKTNQFKKLVSENWKSGLTVALISIPLSIALSISSGAGPLPGIITGIWATALASVFASSNYNIIGAAGALTTVVFAATLNAPLDLGPHILPFIAIATGLLMLVVWALGIDRFLYYIPSSVMYGFSAGVAFQIAASELFDAGGLSTLKRTGSFLGDVNLYAHHLSQTHIVAVATCAVFLYFILLWKRYVPTFPAVIPAATLGIIFGALQAKFFHLDLMSLGERFGHFSVSLALPISLPTSMQIVSSPTVLTWLFATASTITLIAILETLITAKIASTISRTQFSSRKELFGLAIANIGSGIMGGLPATGVFIRTGTNLKTGATHRTSAFLAALFTAIIAVVVLPFFTLLPMAVIAAMLINTAIGLIDIHKFKEFLQHEKESFVVALIVATLTVLVNAAFGVLIGSGLALLLFVNRVSHGRFDAVINFKDGTKQHLRGETSLHIPHHMHVSVMTYSLAGFLGYIDSPRHAANFRHIAHSKNVDGVIIRLRNLFNLDFEGQEMLAEAVAELTRNHKKIYITSGSPLIMQKLKTLEALRVHIPESAFCEKTEDALKKVFA